jgi:hypothetical protein
MLVLKMLIRISLTQLNVTPHLLPVRKDLRDVSDALIAFLCSIETFPTLCLRKVSVSQYCAFYSPPLPLLPVS